MQIMCGPCFQAAGKLGQEADDEEVLLDQDMVWKHGNARDRCDE